MLADVDTWMLAAIAGVAALAILLTGPLLAHCAETVSDRFGIASSLIGGLMLGAITSLPGIIASVTAALDGRPELAASNAVGGIAAQTAFIAVADLFYRRANLEHDAADLGNVVQSLVLLGMLTLPLIAALCPLGAGWPIHPATPLLVVVYLAGMRQVQRSSERPMWLPRGGSVRTAAADAEPTRVARLRTAALLATAAACGIAVAAAGWALSRAGGEAADRFGWPEASVGALAIAVITSLPELVTTVAAVRRGALGIAFGGVMGGNAFDVLFLAASDAAYPAGSIYHAAGNAVWFQLALTCTMVAILVLGLTLRQRRGPANIGFESTLVLACYLLGAAVLATWSGG